jgi:hypothetical protein
LEFTEDTKRYDDTAAAVAKMVAGVCPEINEYKLRGRLFEYFTGDHPSPGIFTDTFFYFPGDVRDLLEGSVEQGADADDDTLCLRSDLQWAFDQLPMTYQYRVVERYVHGVSRPSGSAERAQFDRAIQKMADALNWWNRTSNHNGPGAREVYSNARAAAEIRTDYNSIRTDYYSEW